LKLAIAGTHPFQLWADRLISENDRYERLHRKYQWLVQRMNVYGLHVHVGVQSGELALAISYALAPYLPHLLALSANSPFWQGKDTGMQSCRCSIMESLPYSGPPPLFQSWAEFEKYYEALHTVGAISSIKDLYWYIRPNLEYGTLEFRICDAISTLDETMAVVALIQCLVCSASEDIKTNPTKSSYNREFQWIIPENQWNAARYGLKAIVAMPDGRKENIADGILQLIKRLTPTAEKLDCLEDLMHIQHMVEQGNNAEKQRRLFQTTQSLQALVSSSISDFEKIANSGMKK
jgi:carboxylate-amine ligase